MEQPIKPAVLEKIQRLRLMDDELMTACFSDDLECTQLILQIILGKPDLTVKSSRTQVTLKNLQGRSLRLDVLAQDASGMYTNVEVQRASKGANPRRARYHGSLLDSNVVEPGENFEKIPETYIIFITEEDFFGEGLPVYRVKKTLEGTDLTFDDGMHVIYVNGAYRGEDKLGELMHDFSCSNPDDMYFKALADRTRYFKTSEGGMRQMSEIMENWISEEKEKIALNMLKDGKLSVEDIAKYVEISIEKVQELAGEKTA